MKTPLLLLGLVACSLLFSACTQVPRAGPPADGFVSPHATEPTPGPLPPIVDGAAMRPARAFTFAHCLGQRRIVTNLTVRSREFVNETSSNIEGGLLETVFQDQDNCTFYAGPDDEYGKVFFANETRTGIGTVRTNPEHCNGSDCYAFIDGYLGNDGATIASYKEGFITAEENEDAYNRCQPLWEAQSVKSGTVVAKNLCYKNCIGGCPNSGPAYCYYEIKDVNNCTAYMYQKIDAGDDTRFHSSYPNYTYSVGDTVRFSGNVSASRNGYCSWYEVDYPSCTYFVWRNETTTEYASGN